MTENNLEKHLDVYENRYILHRNNEIKTFYQGLQNEETKARYEYINKILEEGYLESKYNALQSIDFTVLSEGNKLLLRNLVNGITSEVGRALVGLAFLQLAIKSIAPEQSVRLHKGATRRGSFSWEDGISMRTIDSTYNTPFLREFGLLNMNKYGVFMTRSLAENYPYTSLYKAEMRGPFNDWIKIVDAIEDKEMPSELGLCYLMALLRNRSEYFKECAYQACDLVNKYNGKSFIEIKDLISTFFNTTEYSARAFEVSMHAFFQALNEMNLLGDAKVAPISQMRSANKKHGNVGDIELIENNVIIEAWDAKYGKPYLRDELEELRDKLLDNPDVRVAGFVVNTDIDMRADILRRKSEVEVETDTEILLLTFDMWVDSKVAELEDSDKDLLAFIWLLAIVESFAQRRLEIAPIDEPCEAWIRDLIGIMNG